MDKTSPDLLRGRWSVRGRREWTSGQVDPTDKDTEKTNLEPGSARGHEPIRVFGPGHMPGHEPWPRPKGHGDIFTIITKPDGTTVVVPNFGTASMEDFK
jgi:hypothetical protein